MISDIRNKAEINIIDIISVILKHRRVMITITSIIVLISILYSLIMPKTFRAAAMILPSQESGGMLSSLSGSIPFGLKSIIGGGTSDDVNTLLAILGSRKIALSTIKHFKLDSLYESDNVDWAIKTFRNNFDFSYEDEGTIEISMLVKTPYLHYETEEEKAAKLSSEIVNYVVEELNRIYVELQTKAAKAYREFIEIRYNKSLYEIKELEKKYKDFSRRSGIILLPEQVKASLEIITKLEAQQIIKTIELQTMRRSFHNDHPKIRELEIELQELTKRLNDFKAGSQETGKINIFPGFKNLPENAMQYVELEREQKVQELIFAYLTQEYEQAKLQEAKDTPTVQIIDRAEKPLIRYSPKRSLIVIITMFLGIFLSLFIIFIKEYILRLKLIDNEKYLNFENLLKEVRRNILGKKTGKN